jgi:ribosomal protein S18 acetylase RimI-like enzyme
MAIRSYQVRDAADLAAAHNEIYPDEPLTVAGFHQRVVAYGRSTWIMTQNDKAVGVTAVTTIPGLPHIRVLHGFIAPSWQRQGLGSQLLQHVLAELRGERGEERGETKDTQPLVPSLQLSYCVDDVNSPAYHFLRHHHFYIEHEELHLVLPSPPHLLTSSPLPAPITLPRAQAVRQFISLYDQSFGPHPWYQPYTAEEVATLLVHPHDLLFARDDDHWVGFVWIKMIGVGLGEIEPIGVLAEWQGKGYGRFLLQTAVNNLRQREAKKIHIGAWATNTTALHLYDSLGFQHDHTLAYLAYDL